MSKKVTIYDLANVLNVSPTTVSRSLNNHHSISKKTKDRVISKAEELGYKVNKFAVNLRTQKTNTIGVIIPKLNSNFMSRMLAGVEKVINESGYNLIISQSLESMEKEIINTKTLFNSGVDALIVSLAFDTDSFDHFMPYLNANIPLMFIDRVHSLPNCTTIVINNVQAGYDATTHLIEQGCKEIILVAGNLKQNVYSERRDGYKKALEAHGIQFKERHIIETDLESSNVAEVVDFINNSQTKIDAIFVLNDSFAAQCIKELSKQGIEIPNHIKVVGFNNDPISELFSPSLTTIDYPGFEMGMLAGESILNQLNGTLNLKTANALNLRHELIVRESTK